MLRQLDETRLYFVLYLIKPLSMDAYMLTTPDSRSHDSLALSSTDDGEKGKGKGEK